uniref:Uncharacterized protein n=1 Tax=Romanomermis culicivorax TaxID=13658 RepID=A0A915I4L9_ROMCU
MAKKREGEDVIEISNNKKEQMESTRSTDSKFVGSTTLLADSTKSKSKTWLMSQMHGTSSSTSQVQLMAVKEKVPNMQTYDQEVKRHFTNALTIIQKKIEDSQKKYKEQYDKKAHRIDYKEIIEICYPNVIVRLCDNPNVVETLHVNRTKQFHPTTSARQSMPQDNPKKRAFEDGSQNTGSTTPKIINCYIPYPGNDTLEEDADSSNEDDSTLLIKK